MTKMSKNRRVPKGKGTYSVGLGKGVGGGEGGMIRDII